MESAYRHTVTKSARLQRKEKVYTKMKFIKSINFPDEYKITQSDGVDSVYLHLDELEELKKEIEEALNAK